MSDVPRVVVAVARSGCRCVMEQDKIPGFWVVTAWPGEHVVLRVRIRHHTNEMPCDIFCEIRHRGETEFRLLATFATEVWDILQCKGEMGFQAYVLPLVWRREFREMIRRWAVCTWIVECGSATEIRYAGEPESSRDCLEFADV